MLLLGGGGFCNMLTTEVRVRRSWRMPTRCSLVDAELGTLLLCV